MPLEIYYLSVLLTDSMGYWPLRSLIDFNFIEVVGKEFFGNTFPHLDYYSLQKIDTTGLIVITKQLSVDSSSNVFEYSIYPTADSGFYLIKDKSIWINNHYQVVNRTATKYNGLLDSIFSKQLDPNTTINQTRNLDFYLFIEDQTGMKNITWLNANLDTISSRSFNDSIVWYNPYPLINGDWVFFRIDGSNVFFTKEDSTSSLLWSRPMFPVDSSTFRPWTLIQTSDKGFLIGGYHDFYNGSINNCNPLYSTSVVMKTDSLGNSSRTITDINEINGSDNGISIYPNPFISSTYINLKDISEERKFELFNVLGIKVKTIKLNKEIIQLNKDNLSSGIYFYRVTDISKIIETGKLIVE